MYVGLNSSSGLNLNRYGLITNLVFSNTQSKWKIYEVNSEPFCSSFAGWKISQPVQLWKSLQPTIHPVTGWWHILFKTMIRTHYHHIGSRDGCTVSVHRISIKHIQYVFKVHCCAGEAQDNTPLHISFTHPWIINGLAFSKHQHKSTLRNSSHF